MPDAPVVDVRDLTYVYPQAADPAVAALGFQVPRGEIFGLLGPRTAGYTVRVPSRSLPEESR